MNSNQNRCREGDAKGTGTVFHIRKLEERGLFGLPNVETMLLFLVITLQNKILGKEQH